jgi:hypothetical protein
MTEMTSKKLKLDIKSSKKVEKVKKKTEKLKKIKIKKTLEKAQKS